MRYFAYGSNLDLDDLRRFCVREGYADATFEKLGRAYLPDRRLVFHYHSPVRGGGALDTAAQRGCTVSGLLLEVDALGFSALDQKEGVQAGRYRRRPIVVLSRDGQACEAVTYEVCETYRQSFVPPRDEYVAIVARGLRAHGFDVEPLLRAAAGRAPSPSPTRVFVYGTLMRGQGRWSILARHGVVSVERAQSSGSLLHLGAYPGFVPASVRSGKGGRVYGDLVELAAIGDALGVLDEVEDFQGYGASGSLYRRSLIEARVGGQRFLAWTYVYVGSTVGALSIASGDWTTVLSP